MRLRLRQIFGADLAAPLVYDLPHNITLPAGMPSRWITRKGACPADAGQPVIIPGSMGAPSYLLVGRGQPAFLCSASHGAGRAKSRFTMSNHTDQDAHALGLEGVLEPDAVEILAVAEARLPLAVTVVEDRVQDCWG